MKESELPKPKEVRLYVDYIAGKRCLIPFIEDWKALNHEEKEAAIAFMRKEENKMMREDEEMREKCRKISRDILRGMGYEGENHE